MSLFINLGPVIYVILKLKIGGFEFCMQQQTDRQTDRKTYPTRMPDL